MAKFPIPDAVWEQHVAILAKPGRGKTVTAKGGAARLMKHGFRVGAVDPTAAWWGMRLKADGKSPAFPMVIFGGDHADIPITPQMGEKVGALTGAADWSFVIDTSTMGKDARTEFFTGWAEAIFATNRRRLNLFLDECHLFIPQQSMPGRAAKHMLAAGNNLIAGGRGRGFCVTMISQRPAKVAKDSLTATESLVVLGMIAPQDVNAVKAWVDIQGAASAETRAMIGSLPSLPVGTGWLYAPTLDILERMKFPMIDTFDSSRAPGAGDPIMAPKELAQINIEEIRSKLAPGGRKVVPKAEKSSTSKPVEKINTADVKAQIRALADARVEGYAAGYQEGDRDGFARGAAIALEKGFGAIQGALKAFAGVQFVPPKRLPSVPKRALVASSATMAHPPSAPAPIVTSAGAGGTVEAPLQRILNSIKWWNVMGVAKPSHAQVAFMAGYSHKSGTWATYLSKLRSSGLIEGRGDLMLTGAGDSEARPPEVPPTADILRQTVLDKIDAPLRKILIPVLEAYPGGLSHEDAGAAAGYSHSSGTWATYLSKLRTLDLIEGRGELKAQDWLFP